MIEIVFSDSACGALKLAQTFGKGEYKGSSIGVFISHGDGSTPTQAEVEEETRKYEEQERQKWEQAIPLGGNPADVFGFHLGLSYGNIQDPLCMGDRLSAMQLHLSCWNDDLQDECTELILQAQSDLKIVLDRIASGEDVRIWYSENPDELCGFYWFIDQLRLIPDGNGAVLTVKLPDIVENKDTIRRYRGWGEVEPGEFHNFLDLSTPLSAFMRRYYSDQWKKLQMENAKLRASVNGGLSSVPENLYDHCIFQEIACQPDTFKEAIIVGNVLGKHGLSVSDGFIHSRIDALVKEGKLIAATAPKQGDPGYWRILKKVY